MSTKTRGIRFSESEEKKISEFLKQNSFFDFSSLARTAILNFIQSPTVKIRPISMSTSGSKAKKKESEVRNGNA